MPHRRSVSAIAFAVAMTALPGTASATAPGANGGLVWQRESAAAPPRLWIAGADGTQARRVFGVAGAADLEGAWSPVAPTTLAFTRGTEKPFSEEIFVGDVATGKARPLTDTRSAAIAPAFSPDGSRIVYFSVRPPGRNHPPGPARITVVNADGTGMRVLTPANRESNDPDFSPDGTRIVYTEGRQTGPAAFDNRLMVMNADGSGRRALTAWGGRREINPKWMPDGTAVVFESMTQRGLRSDVEVVAADGSGRRPLLATPAYETNPIPSPDGTRIAFTSDRDRRGPVRLGPGFEVYTARFDGTDVVRVTRNRVPDLFPDWQRLPVPMPAGAAQAGGSETDVGRAGAQHIRITGDWLAAGAGTVWLSGQTEIFRFDARSARREATIRVPQGPCQASDVGFGALWTATCRRRGLARIGERTNRVIHVRLPVSVDYGGEGSVGAGAGGVWVVTDGADCTACRVVRVNPRTMRVTASVAVRIGAAGVRTGAGSVWVTNPVEDIVQQIAPRRARVVRTIATGPGPRFFGVGEGAVWTLDQVDGSVTRIDARTGRTSRIRTDVVGEGGDLTVGGGSVWARGSDRLLVRIDPERRRVVERYGPPSGSGAVIVAGGAVWISAHDVNTVWRLPLEDA